MKVGDFPPEYTWIPGRKLGQRTCPSKVAVTPEFAAARREEYFADMAFAEECDRQLAAREARASRRQNERQLAAAEEPREPAVVGSGPKPQPDNGGGSGGGGGGGGGEGGGGGSGRPRATPGHSRAAHDSPKRRSMPFSPLTAAAQAAREAAQAGLVVRPGRAGPRSEAQKRDRQLAAAEAP